MNGHFVKKRWKADAFLFYLNARHGEANRRRPGLPKQRAQYKNVRRFLPSSTKTLRQRSICDQPMQLP